MAHIVRAKIDGLQGRKSPVEFHFHRDINIIFGENGCGKTNLLRILHSALSRDSSIISFIPARKAEIDIFSINQNEVLKHIWSRRSESEKKFQLEFQHNELAEEAQKELSFSSRRPRPWQVQPKNPFNDFPLQHEFLPTSRLYSTEPRPSPQSRHNPNDLEKKFTESINRKWLEFNSSVLTRVRRIQEAGLQQVLFNSFEHNTATPEHLPPNLYSSYRLVSTFLKRQGNHDVIKILGEKETFISRISTDARLRRTVHTLSQVESDIQKAMEPLNNFKTTISKLFSRGKSIKPTSNGLRVQLEDESEISTAMLSSGEKHLLQILLTCLHAGPNTVLIDEPELSMHIDWQRTLLNTILSLNPECQLIIASHSPEIMADIEDEKIFSL